MNKIRVLAIIVLIGLGLVAWWMAGSSWDGKSDFKMGVLSNDNLWLVSVSPERKLTNVMKINPDVEVWIPGGMGWYKVGVLKKILEQEKNQDKLGEILFYNFGFMVSRVAVMNGENWSKPSLLVGEMGIFGYFRYFIENRQMLAREETLTQSQMANGTLLDETLPRDFADNKTLSDDITVTIINTSEYSGLANFISQRLEWSGISVISTENGTDKVSNCVLVSNKKNQQSPTFLAMIKMLKCEIKTDENLGEKEVELFLGEGMAKMIKYSSYVRTF